MKLQVRLLKLDLLTAIQKTELIPFLGLPYDEGFTENLSQGGLGMRWERRSDGKGTLSAGDRVLADIVLPSMRQHLRCAAKIAWICAEGDRFMRAGLAFEGFNLEDLALVQSLVANHGQ
jgi:hypothetical protein